MGAGGFISSFTLSEIRQSNADAAVKSAAHASSSLNSPLLGPPHNIPTALFNHLPVFFLRFAVLSLFIMSTRVFEVDFSSFIGISTNTIDPPGVSSLGPRRAKSSGPVDFRKLAKSLSSLLERGIPGSSALTVHSSLIERSGIAGTPVRALEFVTLPKAGRGGRQE